MGTVSDDIGPCEPRKTETELSPEQAAAAAMVAEARQRGLELTGPRGLLKLFIKNVLEAALNEELTEHLGHEKNRAEPDRGCTNIRKGSRPKTVLSDAAARWPSRRRGIGMARSSRTSSRRGNDV
jgi:putative transposase